MNELKVKKNLKVKRVSMVEQVCSGIKECIKNGEWEVHEKIPSEGELSEMFGVNRLTVRMALQKLSTLGIVETRVGEGTFVKNFSFKKYISEVSEFYMRPELLDDVCEFRKLLEIECARLAIERATPEELKQLEELSTEYVALARELHKSEKMDEEMFEKLIELDLEFHEKIVKMSKNSLYVYSFVMARESIYQYLGIIIKQRLDSFRAKYKNAVDDGACNLHYVIYRAIAEKDFETCKKAYLDMVDHNVDL